MTTAASQPRTIMEQTPLITIARNVVITVNLAKEMGFLA